MFCEMTICSDMQDKKNIINCDICINSQALRGMRGLQLRLAIFCNHESFLAGYVDSRDHSRKTRPAYPGQSDACNPAGLMQIL